MRSWPLKRRMTRRGLDGLGLRLDHREGRAAAGTQAASTSPAHRHLARSSGHGELLRLIWQIPLRLSALARGRYDVTERGHSMVLLLSVGDINPLLPGKRRSRRSSLPARTGTAAPARCASSGAPYSETSNASMMRTRAPRSRAISPDDQVAVAVGQRLDPWRSRSASHSPAGGIPRGTWSRIAGIDTAAIRRTGTGGSAASPPRYSNSSSMSTTTCGSKRQGFVKASEK